jgi:hypothetical protein
MDPKGRVYIAAEYFSQQQSHTVRSRELWDLVRNTVPLEDDDWFVFYCDTANPQDILELNTWANEVGARMAFASLDQGLKARSAGVQRVQEYMQPSIGRATPEQVVRETPRDGEPLLYFFDTLTSSWQDEEEGYNTSRLIWEIQRYLWKRTKRGAASPDGADDNSAGGAHQLSSLRYLIMARMGAPAEPEEQKYGGMDEMVRRHMMALDERMTQRMVVPA